MNMFLQWFQNSRTFRCDDISNGHRRLAAICMHLYGVRHGLLASVLYNLSNVRQFRGRESGTWTQSDLIAHGELHCDVSDVARQLWRLLRWHGVHGSRNACKGQLYFFSFVVNVTVSYMWWFHIADTVCAVHVDRCRATHQLVDRYDG